MRRWSKVARRGDATLGLVPTMGALHAGHVSLLRSARASCDVVAASIFVNPLQFGPNEDFSAYPRTFADDCAVLEREGVDLLFAPSAAEMYPPGRDTMVDVPEVGARLDGASRPGHFRGVATVVSKLFHIVAPQRAFFGQKDAAQVAVLRSMVRDLNFDVEMVVCPTVRDADGLALSSRNRYLSVLERAQALVLPRALQWVELMIRNGERDATLLCEAMLMELQLCDGVLVDYVEIVNPDSLEPVTDTSNGALAAVAAWVGRTRLIDNVLIEPAARPKAVSAVAEDTLVGVGAGWSGPC